MNAAGIIAEYNPFHRGHQYHIEKTRQLTGCSYVIVVMSGSFVQRGAPAMLDKHLRTEMALRGGADLVLELPTAYAVSSAEHFAGAGIEILDRLGVISAVSFGCETDDPALLMEAARLLEEETPERKAAITSRLKDGLPYAKARLAGLPEQVVSLLSSPNNILAAEYCRALLKRKSSAAPLPVLREGSGYHDGLISGSFPSASGIRSLLKNSESPSGFSGNTDSLLTEAVGADEAALLIRLSEEHKLLSEDDLSLLLRAKLMTADKAALTACPEITSDLADRMLKLRRQYITFSQFAGLLKTKNIAYSRICRGLIQLLLDIRGYPVISDIRVLGFRRSSSVLLSEIKKRGDLGLVTSLNGAGTSPAELYPDLVWDLIQTDASKQPLTDEYSKNMVIL